MRKKIFSALSCALLGALVLAGAPAHAADSGPGQLASVVPVAGTPHVLDGRVYSVEQVGTTMVLGGTFTSARNDSDTASLSRTYLLAFDTVTKKISTTFVPQPNGVVNVVRSAGDGTSVYVGGNFTSIGGVAVKNLARIRLSDGAVMTSFNAGSVAGAVNDLRLAGGRLWVAGAFTHIAGNAQLGLATINPTTGAFTSFMRRTLSGQHHGGVTAVLKIDITSDARSLVLIGNFDMVDGVKKHQIAMLDISGTTATVTDWQTAFYETACSASFNTYMRDIAFSPDDSYFVVVTTGAYGGAGTACDSGARFETASRGTAIKPSWVNNTGGDTQLAVEIKDNVVYTGGHPRWQNNPFAGDKAGQGAISREGLAALNPLNGLPYSWNPTRTRGYGVTDFLVSPAGLWIGSDTDRIGNYYYRGRIALMPFTGTQFPAYKTPTLPNDVYSVSASGITRRTYAAGTFGPAKTVPTTGIDWSTVRGAFMLNGQLYVAASDGSFTRRTFDGTTLGSPVPVNASDQIVPLTDWQTDIKTMTGLFYDNGRLYFTRAGSPALTYRYFNPESDVVGAQRLTASTGGIAGIDLSKVKGMFKAGSRMYWTTGDGSLRSIAWQDGPIAGTPVAGTADVVSGPAVDSSTWVGGATFPFQDSQGGPAPAPQAPTAAFTSSCAELSCTFDAAGSADKDGTIASYHWTFSDGSTADGAQVGHDFATAGSYTAGLTVTDNDGMTGTTQKTLTVSQAKITSVGAASTNGNRSAHTVTVPSAVQAGDQLLAYLTTNDSAVAVTGPDGWSPVTSQLVGGTAVRVWSRTATAADAGKPVTATSASYLKSDMSVAAYRSTTGALKVSAADSVLSTATATSHTTPTLTSDTTGQWLVSYWSKESSTVPTWTPPAGQTLRTSSTGSGSGNVSAILTDGDRPVGTGTVGGLTATTSDATTRTPMVSILLALQ
jgi:hypothetical protein